MDIIIAIFVFGIFILIFIWGYSILFKQKSDDKKEIISLSNEDLITDYQRTIFQINKLPKYLMHGDIHKHSRLIRNLTLIENELKNRGIDIK